MARECREVKIVVNHFGGPLGVGPLQARRGVSSMARRHQGALGLPKRLREARRAGDDRQGFRLSLGAIAAVIRSDGQCLAALCRDLHRKFRCQPLHVRKQLPGRQGRLQLSGAVQRVQTAGTRRLGIGKADLFAGTASRFYQL